MAAQGVSQLGDWAARLALALLVFDRTGSALLTGAVAAVTLAPWVGVGQVLAGLGDRYGHRRAMLWSDVGRAVVFAFIAVVHMPVGALLALAFVAGCFDPPFEASRSSAIVDSVPSEDYPDAIALSAGIEQFGILVGYAIGGGLVSYFGAEAALGINAATFVLSGLLIYQLPRDVPSGVRDTVRVGDGLHHIRGDGVIRHAFGWFCVLSFFAMAIEAQVAPFAREVAGFPESQVGLLATMVTVSGIVATFTLRVRRNDLRLCRMAGILGLLGGGGALVAVSLGTSALLAYLLFFFVGVTFTGIIPVNAAAGRRIPQDIRASTFGLIQAALLGAQGLGALAGGGLAELIGIRQSVVVMAAGAALTALAALATLPRRYLLDQLVTTRPEAAVWYPGMPLGSR